MTKKELTILTLCFLMGMSGNFVGELVLPVPLAEAEEKTSNNGESKVIVAQEIQLVDGEGRVRIRLGVGDWSKQLMRKMLDEAIKGGGLELLKKEMLKEGGEQLSDEDIHEHLEKQFATQKKENLSTKEVHPSLTMWDGDGFPRIILSMGYKSHPFLKFLGAGGGKCQHAVSRSGYLTKQSAFWIRTGFEK